MRVHRLVAAFAALLIVSSARAQTEDSTPYSRRNPVVDAVQKTEKAIVTVKIPRQGKQDSTGTGVIVDPRGILITNRHVVGSNRQVKVTLWDNSEVVGMVLAAEAQFDLAIVQIQTSRPLAALGLRNVNDLMVGESVIAIGHPYGYTNTVSTGIISAVNREITMPTGDVLRDLIQTSAPINPGNSGGPLLNINGELIGINVALRDGAQNIAFAINARTVVSFLSKHRAAHKVAGIDHGLKAQEKILGQTDRQRLVLTGVHAYCAELKPGDEILAVGEHSVANTFDIERALSDKKPGQQVPLKIQREGREVIVLLTLQGTSPSQLASVQSPPRPTPKAQKYYIP